MLLKGPSTSALVMNLQTKLHICYMEHTVEDLVFSPMEPVMAGRQVEQVSDERFWFWTRGEFTKGSL